MEVQQEKSNSQRKWARAATSRSAYARRRRTALCEKLSPDGTCEGCGEKFAHAALTIDHIDGCTWNKTRVSAWMRAARYWREHRSGIRIRALCRRCNSSFGAQFRGRRRWS